MENLFTDEEATKMCLSRIMLKKPYTEHVSNDEDLKKKVNKNSCSQHQEERVEITRVRNNENGFEKYDTDKAD